MATAKVFQSIARSFDPLCVVIAIHKRSERIHRSKHFSVATRSYLDKRHTLWNAEVARQKAERNLSSEHIHIQLEAENVTFDLEDIPITSTILQLLPRLSDAKVSKILRSSVAAVFHTNVSGIHEEKIIDLSAPLYHSGRLRLLKKENFLAFFRTCARTGSPLFFRTLTGSITGIHDAQALELQYQNQIKLCDGPALSEGGFFYEFFLEGKTISELDFAHLEAQCKRIIKQKQKFERLEVDREFARQMFAYSEFKLKMLDKIKQYELITLYRNGDLIDLCRGPHVPHTGFLQALRITKCGASHWGDKGLLQRVYGISFPSKEQLKQWQHDQEEAMKRDHRVIGKQQKLFMFHRHSPGSPFFLPHGTRIFSKLVDMIRHEYKVRGYDEVMTPQLYKKQLWDISGHWENYKDDMFILDQGVHAAPDPTDKFGLKPMNCPGHCLIFKESKKYSYRELPIRLADFSALHRNEASGSLGGLTRVRRFHQDDAHIFCREDQVRGEIADCLAFIQHIYGSFGFNLKLALSTRPNKYMGDLRLWKSAEQQLENALHEFGQPWTLKQGDGAFYGPKIDVSVTDALKRHHQCGTIQLDFQLPLNFQLEYDGPDGLSHTPIIIHRAVLGSIERMMAILIEHTAGRWPLWLSPRQIAILPVSETYQSYAHTIAEQIRSSSSVEFIDVLQSNKTLSKRMREAQIAKYNFIMVVGEEEVKKQIVQVRARDNKEQRAQTLAEFIDSVDRIIENKR